MDTKDYEVWTSSLGIVFVKTDYNLIEAYKTAIKRGFAQLEWDKGIVNVFDIVAIIEK
jgi:hypothetical protein